MRPSPLVIGEHHGPRGRDLAAPRRPRRSRRRLCLWLGATVVTVGLLAWGVTWLLTSPLFEVARVQSGRYRYSSEDSVQAALGGCLGRNIWLLHRQDVAGEFEALPWVREVRLERRIPDTVTVELTEWRPLLAVADPAVTGGERLLVGDGRVLTIPAHLDAPGLPLLVDARLETAPDGVAQLVHPQAADLLALVAALETSGLESACPVDFVRATPEGFVLVLQGRAGTLLLGRTDYDARLARFLLARDRLPEGAAVDLRFEDRITFEPPRSGRS